VYTVATGKQAIMQKGACSNMDETFMKARAYLAQNYSDPELSLTDLCHYLGFSCSYFSTLFKQKTGLNYSHYITSLRLEQAARLLTDTDDTALSIGYQVGYSAPNYFSRAFKKFYGISPSRYREQNRVPTV
uniref:helix-turn-helix domain-containing protein n=1 Tax=Enterocloster sp. TaxID=2719315 RepID=UPI003FF0F6CC